MESDLVMLVVDPDYGERLRAIAGYRVWVIKSPQNDEFFAFENYAEGSARFDVDDPAATEANVLGQINDLDLHFGAYSSDSPYRRIRVIGARLSPTIMRELEALGFAVDRELDAGFELTAPSQGLT